MTSTLIANALPSFRPGTGELPDRLTAQSEEVLALTGQLAELFLTVPQLPDLLRRGWVALKRAAGRGQLEALHAARDEYRAGFDHVIATARVAEAMAGTLGLPSRAELKRTVTDLERLRASIFDGWDTIDDLADKVMDEVSPSNAELLALAERYPPPQSWYDEPGLAPPEPFE